VKVSLALLALLLAGCVNVKETSTPDGRAAHAIDCSGNTLSWTDCHEKAASICGASRYSLVSGGPQPGLGDPRAESGLFGGTRASRNMVVQCKQ
jgi:hypothetical protein